MQEQGRKSYSPVVGKLMKLEMKMTEWKIGLVKSRRSRKTGLNPETLKGKHSVLSTGLVRARKHLKYQSLRRGSSIYWDRRKNEEKLTYFKCIYLLWELLSWNLIIGGLLPLRSLEIKNGVPTSTFGFELYMYKYIGI